VTLSRRVIAFATYLLIAASGIALILYSLPGFVRFLPAAPHEFWALLIVSLLLESAPLVLPHVSRQPTQLAVSLSLTFAILLLWGPAVAIVVQALALGVAELRVRRPLTDFAITVARFSVAFQVAGWADLWVRPGPVTVGMNIDEFGFWTTVLTALVWFAVDFGVIVVLLAAAGPAAWRVWVGSPLFYDMAGTGALLMVTPVLITAQTGWMIAFVAIPLGIFGLISRVLLAQERKINRDPVTDQQSPQRLDTNVDRFLSTPSLTSDAPHLGFLEIRLFGLDEVTNVFGQQITDNLMAQVGKRIGNETSDANATLARVADADFVVVLPRADIGGAERVANAIGRSLLAPIDVDGVVFNVTPTIGIAVAPADGSDLRTLTGKAETAIMEARRTGSLVQTVHSRDDVEARRRFNLLVDLRAAIEKPEHAGELFMVYQPQVRISDGDLVGIEALVRWRHPDRGLIDTEDMILTAEASGQICPLTLWIIDDVLEQLAAWTDTGIRLRASVNVSGKDIASDGFAHKVQQSLQRHSTAPEQLELEVTETALAGSIPAVNTTVTDLVAMGVALSLDDFGTGYASLQQLRQYPLKELKIDRSYIAAMNTSLPDRAVIRSITQLATDLGLRVVAEGVEDAATAAALDQLGPLIAQGWHYGRPMTAPDLAAWIGERNHPT
jgi:predicted signal transduction protein with EAL and GGDEF domain